MKYIERFAVVIAAVLFIGMVTLGYERSGKGQTPVPLVISPSVTNLAQPMRTAGDGDDTGRASQPHTLPNSSRHPRAEEIARVPLQIQDQVAAAVLTPAPLRSPLELMTLPLQIQQEVRQAQLLPTP